MAGSIWRGRVLVTAAVAVAALGLSACGSSGSPGGTNTSNPGDSQLGGAPSDSASPGTQATGGPSASAANGPVYPRDAKSYALELLKAYSRADLNRIGQLTTSDALAMVRDNLNSPDGAPNGTWTYIKCTPASSTTACVYRNANGDESEVTMTNGKLGASGAVTMAQLDRTRFSDNDNGYIGAFVGAWSAGNYQRMLVYSNKSVADYFKGRPPITSYTPGPDGTGYYCICGIGNDLGKAERVKLDLAKLGKPNAITAYKASP